MAKRATMSSSRTGRLLCLVGTTAICAPAFAMADADRVAATQPGIGEIVVTAQKREQNLQNVPISITALTATTLQANRIADIRDLGASAPNLSIRPIPGGAASVTFTLRGLYGIGSTGQDKGVALYLDGVYLNNTVGSVFELADLERIEILKGPQGTLFGRNSVGGAINLITRDPSGTFGARQTFTYGNYNQLKSVTRVDLPAVGPLSASFSYLHSERRGDIRNLGAGTVWDYSAATNGRVGKLVSPKWLGDHNTEAASAALKLKASSDLKITYKFDYSKDHYTADGVGYSAVYPPALGPAAPLVGVLLGFQPDPEVLTIPGRSRPDAVNNAFTVPGSVTNQGHNVTARFTPSDSITLTNVFSYRQTRLRTAGQLDGAGGLINLIPQLGSVGQPFEFLAFGVDQRERQWSNETQLNFITKWFTLTAGYLHFNVHVNTGGIGSSANTQVLQVIPGGVIPDVGGRPTSIDITSNAVFAQGEFHVIDGLDLVLGTRLTADRKSGIDRTLLVSGGPELPFNYKGDKPTFLLGLNYKVAQDSLIYAKYSTGYVSGGVVGTLAFSPQTAGSWEAGAKTELFDRKLRTNAAIWLVNYKGIQNTTSGFNAGVPNIPTVVINSGDAKAYGFELETTLLPLPNLMLQANLGYTNFHYTSVNPLFGTKNNYLPVFVPKWTNSFTAEYQVPDIWRGGRFVLRADASYRSRFAQYPNPPTELIKIATTTPSAWLVNSRLAISDVELGRSKVEVAAWVRNIFDDKTSSGAAALGFIFANTYERARTFGVDVSIRY